MDRLLMEDNGPTDEELEKLIEQLKQLDEQNKKRKKKRPRGLIAIEFGGIYHPNRIVNFLFSLIINISLSYTIISLFRFADYKDIYYFLGFIVSYSVIEYYIRDYLLIKYLQYVIKSFGMIFYFTYMVLLYIMDRWVFVGNFTFKHEYHIVAFLTIFVIVRYIIGVTIRRYMRRQYLR